MKKFLTVLFVVILLFCAFNVISVYALKPETDSFRLSVSLSANKCEVGEEINVYAELKNSTPFSRLVKHNGELIKVEFVPAGTELNLETTSEVQSTFVFMFCGKVYSEIYVPEVAGVYDVYFISNFESNDFAISLQQTAKLTVTEATLPPQE